MLNSDYFIIGSNGLLGSTIKDILKKKNIRFLTTAKNKSNLNINLNDFSKLKKFIENNKFKYVINCAAYININECEKNYKKIRKINFLLPKLLTKLSIKHCFKLIQISTDQVYFNKTNILNKENDKIYGLNNYAKSKILSENATKKNVNNLIIRTNFTGRKKTKNNITFVDWLYSYHKNRKKIINLYEDMYSSTIDVKRCAKIIIRLIQKDCSGVYNLGSKNSISKAKFAKHFFKKMKTNIKFNICSSDKLLVKRCKFLGMNVKKIEKKLKIKMPSYNIVINDLCKEYK